MKRLSALLVLLILAAGLCACGRGTPAPAVSETSVPAAVPGPADAPVLSEGAADDSRLSALFQADDSGVYTTVFRAEGVTCLYDVLPEDTGSVAGFFITGDGFWVSAKEYFYSLEPAALYFFPANGGAGRTMADDLMPGGLFCMAGNAVFYETYGDEHLWRLDAAAGETRCVLDRPVQLLTAGDGFIYYAVDGDIFRNDSTMTAETLLFSDPGVRYLFADGTRLCALTFDGAGRSVIALREPDGTLRTEITPDENTDNILSRDGQILVPQQKAGTLLVYGFDGALIKTVPLPDTAGYILLRGAADGTVYYETMRGEDAVIYAADLPSGQACYVGEVIHR